MRCAIYARVSTTDQSCQLQLSELRQYVERRNWQTIDEYIDNGWSGSNGNRPQLARLLSDARTRRFDAVLVWKLDRWGRSVADSIKTIQELTSLGIRFLAVTQNIDTDESNPMSRFLLHIMASFAELERELIRERVAAGLEYARNHGSKSGKAIGRPQRVFRRDVALRLRAEGMSWRAIATKLSVPLSTVRDACAETPVVERPPAVTQTLHLTATA